MAATYTQVPIDSTTISVIKAALNAKSLITSVLYETTQYLIFSTPLTSKVIKINVGGSFNAYSTYYGDAWTSGSTITNSVQISGQGGSATAIHMIADTTFFAFGTVNNITASYQTVCYFGSFDNGDSIALGFVNSSAAGDYVSFNCRNITDSKTLIAVTLVNQDMFDSSTNLFKYDLIWKNAADNKIEMNGSTPAKVLGFCAVTSTGTAWFKGANYLLSPNSLYTATGPNTYTRHQLLFEF